MIIWIIESREHIMGKRIELEEHKALMLDILTAFADFCDRHNLTYFLDAGTLLGAVRHHGFIPWDNDIDVCMLRPDMDKFYILLEKRNFMLNDHIVLEKPEDTIFTYFKLGDIRTDLIEYPNKNPIHCYVYIDVFAKDGIKDKSRHSKRVCDKSGKLALWHWFFKYTIPYWKKRGSFPKRIIANIADAVCKNKNRAYFKQKKLISNYIKKHPLETCRYVTTLSNGEFNGLCDKKCFSDYIFLKFENRMFKAPSGYKEWLTILYGHDYMQLPPIENRRVHEVVIEWKGEKEDETC